METPAFLCYGVSVRHLVGRGGSGVLFPGCGYPVSTLFLLSLGFINLGITAHLEQDISLLWGSPVLALWVFSNIAGLYPLDIYSTSLPGSSQYCLLLPQISLPPEMALLYTHILPYFSYSDLDLFVTSSLTPSMMFVESF